MPDEKFKLSIAEILQSIRVELARSEEVRRESGQEPMFTVGSVDLELKAVFESHSRSSSKVGISIISFGLDEGDKDQQIHTIKIHLDSVLREPNPSDEQMKEKKHPIGLLQTDVSKQDPSR